MKQVLQRIIALLIGVFACGAMTAQTDYGIKIAGKALTSAYANAIDNTNFRYLGLTSGSIIYDHSTKTFTLTNVNADVSSAQSFIDITASAETAEYKIKLVGNNVVTISGNNHAVITRKNLTMEGSGSLKLTTSDNTAIYVVKGTLTIKNTMVTAIGRYGIMGENGTSGEKLVIINSTVKATGALFTIRYFQEIKLEGCSITSPEGAAVAADYSYGMAVMKNGELVSGEVVIEPPVVGYGVYITGTEVTSANASAINHDNFPNFDFNGTITYDHATKTFTFDNFLSNVYADEPFIRISDNAETAEYKIKQVGRNVVSLKGIETSKNLTVEGDGTLKVNLEEGMAFLVSNNSTLTFKNTNVRSYGTWGISGWDGTRGEKLVINNSTVRAAGTQASILDFQNITFTGCAITSPAGATVATYRKGKAVMKDGEVVTEEVVIQPTGTGIDAPQTEPLAVYPNPAGDFVTIETDVIGSPITIVDLSGRVVMTATANDAKTTLNVSSLPTGTYIVRAANRVTKIIKM